MKLLVSAPGCGCWEETVAGQSFVQQLRDLIANRTGIPSYVLRLRIASKQLSDNRFLSDYLEICDNCVVSVGFNCIGGMRRGTGDADEKEVVLKRKQEDDESDARKRPRNITQDSGISSSPGLKNKSAAMDQLESKQDDAEGQGSITSTAVAISLNHATISLHDLLKDEYRDRRNSLKALKDSGLTSRDLDTVQEYCNNDKDKFKTEVERLLVIATKDELFSALASTKLALLVLPAPSSSEGNIYLSDDEKRFVNGVSRVLGNIGNLTEYQAFFKSKHDCSARMGWQINATSYAADEKDPREDALSCIVAGILLRDGLRAHMKHPHLFCEAADEEKEDAESIVSELKTRRDSHSENRATCAGVRESDSRSFDTYLALSASPGMGKSTLIRLLCEYVKDPDFSIGFRDKVMKAITKFPRGREVAKTVESGFDKFVQSCRSNEVYVCAVTFNGSTPPNARIADLKTNLTLRALYDVVRLPEGMNFDSFQYGIYANGLLGLPFLQRTLDVVKAVSGSNYVILATDELMKLKSVKQDPGYELSSLSDCFKEERFEFLFSSLLTSPLETFTYSSGYQSVVVPLGTLVQIKEGLLGVFSRKIRAPGNPRFLASIILAASQYHGRTLEALWNGLDTITTFSLEIVAGLVSTSLLTVSYEQTRNALLGIRVKVCPEADKTENYSLWQSLVSSGVLISRPAEGQSVIPVISLFSLFSDSNEHKESLSPFRDIVRLGPVQAGGGFENFVKFWQVGTFELIREAFPGEQLTLNKLYHLACSEFAMSKLAVYGSFRTAGDANIEMRETMGVKTLLKTAAGYELREKTATARNYSEREWLTCEDRCNNVYLMAGQQAGFDLLSYFKVKDQSKQLILATEVKTNLPSAEGKGQTVTPLTVINKIKLTSEELSHEIESRNEVCFLMLCSCDTAGTIDDMFAFLDSDTTGNIAWQVMLRDLSVDHNFMHVFRNSVVIPRDGVRELVGPSLDNLLYDPSDKCKIASI